MPIKTTWNYAHKELLAILGTLMVATIAVLIFLGHTLADLNTLISQGGNGIGSVLVLDNVLSDVQSMQSGVRGYVLTGDGSFLRSYHNGSQSLPADLRILQNDRQSAVSKAQISQIVQLANQEKQRLADILHTNDTDGQAAAQAMVASQIGDNLVQQLRQQVAEVSSQALRDIGPQQQRSHIESQRALVVGIALGLLALGSCVAVIWYFQRAILKERALESSKNEFLSLASHQLRTPATNVKQYIGLLMDGYMGELSESQKKALDVAYKNNEAEIKIMNDLLDVAKLDLERIQLHKTVTNIAALAREVVKNFTAPAAERQQTIELSGAQSVMANVDKMHVYGVLENLIDNALKYSHPGTKIKVMVVRDQDMVRISVKDQGLGIKKRDYGKLFNKFSRLNNEFSANSEGSGLGLYWVKQIVKLHGGWIQVASSEQRGSMFSVYLPVR